MNLESVKGMFKSKEKHECVFITKDGFEKAIIPLNKITEDGYFDYDKETYAIDRRKKKHVYVKGYANELNTVEIINKADKPDIILIPSYEFKSVVKSKILGDLMRIKVKDVIDTILMLTFANLGGIIIVLWYLMRLKRFLGA